MPRLRSGRLSIRLTQEFLDLCSKTADERGLTLTEFTQQSLMLNVTRKPLTLAELETQILAGVQNNG